MGEESYQGNLFTPEIIDFLNIQRDPQNRRVFQGDFEGIVMPINKGIYKERCFSELKRVYFNF